MLKKIADSATPLLPLPTHLSFSPPRDKFSIKCVLFDVYGTLFISGSGDISLAQKQTANNSSLADLLKKYGKDLDAETVTDAFYTKIKETHNILKSEGIDYPEIVIEKVWADILGFSDLDTAKDFALEYELKVNPVYPMPHLEETLNFLGDKNLELGIISNAQYFTPFLFDAFLGKSLNELKFKDDIMFYSYEHNYAKPSLYLYQQAAYELTKMNIKPQECLYVGNDMLNDIYPADAVGFKTVLFAGDKRSLRTRDDHKLTQGITPYAIITDLEQLEKLI